jgi:hypothetical protein
LENEAHLSFSASSLASVDSQLSSGDNSDIAPRKEEKSTITLDEVAETLPARELQPESND